MKHQLATKDLTTDREFENLQQYVVAQGPLITDGRNGCKWTYHCVGLPKSFIMIKISGQKF